VSAYLKIPVYSLRTGIMAELMFLIVAAMLLIDLVIVKFAERDLVNARLDAGQLFIHAVEQSLGQTAQLKGTGLRNVEFDPRFGRGIDRMLSASGFSHVVVVDREGNSLLSTAAASSSEHDGLLAAREAAATGVTGTQFSGTTWGVVWLEKRDLTVSSPLLLEGRRIGGIAILGSLEPIYHSLRSSQGLTLLYILLDSLILVMVGIVLLSRIVVNPIHKLLKMTEEYKGGEMVPNLGDTSRNEIGELSRALSVMLRRLDENKKELQAHITSLEKANKELRQAQDEIIKSEKLASVGRLSAGVAHEIGNPIGIVLGYLDLLKSPEVRGDERADYLNRMESEVTRIKRIIRQLLDFSRPSSGAPEQTHVHERITSTMNMLGPQPMMEGIETETRFLAKEDLVLADPNHLQQVFLNIVMNAADAIATMDGSPGGGVERKIAIKTLNADQVIQICFSDTGPGIQAEEVTRIFDPFYTTKEPGKGTGLGLSVCYRIVEGLGGTIRAESVLGKGTSIIITLPVMNQKNGGG
jgi:two-component system, NtrC family, sensor kinase